MLQVVEDPLQLSLLLRFHGDEDLGGAAGLAEGRALVQRLAVVLDQHVLVITANTHTANRGTHTQRQTRQKENGEKENQPVDDAAAGIYNTAGTERGFFFSLFFRFFLFSHPFATLRRLRAPI